MRLGWQSVLAEMLCALRASRMRSVSYSIGSPYPHAMTASFLKWSFESQGGEVRRVTVVPLPICFAPVSSSADSTQPGTMISDRYSSILEAVRASWELQPRASWTRELQAILVIEQLALAMVLCSRTTDR